MKKLVVFDLDGTLTASKSPLDPEMAILLHDLLGIVKVAIIAGGDWPQFDKQVISKIPHDESPANLFLLPTCGTKFYQYKGGWKKIYSEDLTADEKRKIIDSLKKTVKEADFKSKKSGERLLKTVGGRLHSLRWDKMLLLKKRKSGTLIL